jgi:hypothetical protein
VRASGRGPGGGPSSSLSGIGGSGGPHSRPSSTSPSQSLSRPSQISTEEAPGVPTQVGAAPEAVQVRLPGAAQTPWPTVQGVPKSSMDPSQSSSMPLQVSLDGFPSPRQAPHLPPAPHVWVPAWQAPWEPPHGRVAFPSHCPYGQCEGHWLYGGEQHSGNEGWPHCSAWAGAPVPQFTTLHCELLSFPEKPWAFSQSCALPTLGQNQSARRNKPSHHDHSAHSPPGLPPWYRPLRHSLTWAYRRFCRWLFGPQFSSLCRRVACTTSS